MFLQTGDLVIMAQVSPAWLWHAETDSITDVNTADNRVRTKRSISQKPENQRNSFLFRLGLMPGPLHGDLLQNLCRALNAALPDNGLTGNAAFCFVWFPMWKFLKTLIQ